MAAGLEAYVKAHWSTAILVCATCSTRLGRGFGARHRQRLATALRRHLGIRRFARNPLGVVEVKCLGMCPRGGVAVVNARHPHRCHRALAGTDLAKIAEALGLQPPDNHQGSLPAAG